MYDLVGKHFTNHVQPYGTRTIVIESVEYNGEPQPGYYVLFPIGPQCIMTLHGTVAEGVEISRLFQYTKTRDIKGERHTVYGVKPHDLEKMSIVTAVCG